MWFKNLQIYRFTRPFDLTVEQLETQLEACAFTPCGSQDISRFGWVKPLGKFGSTLTHAASGHILLCARKEEKMLPGTAYTGFPYRSAWLTVDMVPLFSCASTTTSAEDSAAMSRLRCKKPLGPTGPLSGGYSLITQPFCSIFFRSSRLEAG